MFALDWKAHKTELAVLILVAPRQLRMYSYLIVKIIGRFDFI